MKLNNYECQTTFWEDFSIADAFGVDAVKDTFNRAFAEWKDNYIYLTELVMVLNYKCWHYFGKKQELSELYEKLFYDAEEYAYENLKDEELNYYYRITD
jgi:hypothetical protein